MRGLAAASVLLALLVPAQLPAQAADSDPKPVPKGGPREKAIIAYNDGVKLMLDRKFAEAQARFETAVSLDATIPEAHNNLAFSLRAQGAANFKRALEHYDRALSLKPDFPRAIMYRGVLFVQMGDLDRARAALVRLKPMDAKLAEQLDEAIRSYPMGDGYDSLSPQFD